MAFKRLLLVVAMTVPVLLTKFKDKGSNLEKDTIEIIENGNLTEDNVEGMEKAQKEKIEALELMRLAEEQAKEDEYESYIEKRQDKPKPPSRGGIVKSVPKNNTSMKSYMDYRAITNKSSAQYKLQQKNSVYTDNEGFRRIGNNYMVAIGTYFESNVGQEVEIELSSGTKFNAIVSDIKSDKHTDSMHLSHPDGSVVEFLVDQKNLLPIIRKMGDCSYSEVINLSGDVVSITILQND